MSRIGKKPITIPNGVKVSLNEKTVIVEGPKGKLDYVLPGGITVKVETDSVKVGRQSDSKSQKALHGLVRSLINNMIKGTIEGYAKELEVVGVGYRGQVTGKTLELYLGFTHSVKYNIPEGITVETPKPNQIIVKGIDKTKVGQAAAEIRGFYPPEPYKGKGIKYTDEYIRRKVGKAVA